MSKYAIFFSYTPETWAAMISNPSDRSAAVRAMLEPVSARLESLHFMFGSRDGILIYEAPDAEAAAAISITVGATGAFSRIETHELIEPAQLVSVLGKAAQAAQVYRKPGT